MPDHKFKPCRFCTGTHSGVHAFGETRVKGGESARESVHFVRCGHCGAHGPLSYKGPDHAVTLWNEGLKP